MSEIVSEIVANPPDTLQRALDIVAAWERGETVLSPDGVAVALHLQRAQIGRFTTGAAVEIEAYTHNVSVLSYNEENE